MGHGAAICAMHFLLCYGGKQGYCILCNNHEMQLLHILRQFKSIKSTLADEGHLLESLCSVSILTLAVKKFDVAFHDVKLFKMSQNGITLILDRLEITMTQSGIKLLQEHRTATVLSRW